MRDPSLLRAPDGMFHLVWTTGWQKDQGFGYARSKDLVHWSEQRFIPVMEHEPTTVNVWAPELFYDEPNERFIICWASTIPGRFPDHLEPHDNNQRMYYTTTRDFKEFAPTKLFFDPGFSVIDCAIVKDDRRYVLVLKENTRPQRNFAWPLAIVRWARGRTFPRRLPRTSPKVRACSSLETTGSFTSTHTAVSTTVRPRLAISNGLPTLRKRCLSRRAQARHSAARCRKKF